MRRLFIISAHQGAEGVEGAEGDFSSDPGSVSYIIGGYILLEDKNRKGKRTYISTIERPKWQRYY